MSQWQYAWSFSAIVSSFSQHCTADSSTDVIVLRLFLAKLNLCMVFVHCVRSVLISYNCGRIPMMVCSLCVNSLHKINFGKKIDTCTLCVHVGIYIYIYNFFFSTGRERCKAMAYWTSCTALSLWDKQKNNIQNSNHICSCGLIPGHVYYVIQVMCLYNVHVLWKWYALYLFPV